MSRNPPQSAAPIKSVLTRLAVMVAVIAMATTGAIYGVIWWEERPLDAVESLLDDDKPRDALRSVDRFLRKHPGHAAALILKARSLVALSRWKQAIAIFEQVGVEQPQDLRALSTAYLHREQWSRALPLLNQLVDLHPDDPDILHEAAACAAKMGMYEPALQVSERLAGIPGMEARGLLMVGTLHRRMRNGKKAVESWRRLLEFQPEADDLQLPADEFFRQYGMMLLETGEPEQAIPMLLKSIALVPTPNAYCWLGNACEQTGAEADAIENWRQALELDTTHIDARAGLADSRLRRGDGVKALEILAPLESSPELTARAAFLIQRAYQSQKLADKAEYWRERATQLRKRESFEITVRRTIIETPDSGWAQVVRAYQLAETGNWEDAEWLLSQAVVGESKHQFIRDLQTAIRGQSDLPPLDEFPLDIHE